MISANFQQEILLRLSELCQVYIVGGAVRDAQWGIASKDVDAVIAMPLLEIEEKLLDWGYKPHLIGAHQQTVSVFQGTEHLDLVTFSGNVETDALCRDFTLNAIYQEVQTGKINDPLGGLQDLQARRLKACGCAVDRFTEDPIRILRLIRLAVRYDLSIEKETWLAAVELVPDLQKVAAERLTVELGRILILEEIDKALGLLDDVGYFKICIPELARLKGLVQNRYHTKDAWEHTRQVVKNTVPTITLRLAALFHDLGKWGTASKECYAWGTILLTDHGYEVDGFKLEGKNLERWVNKKVEVHGGRLDNDPDTIIVKRIKPARTTQRKRFEMVPDGKRHFLQHEKESARLVKEILPRFRWSMVLPGGNIGERDLEYLVEHHMLGILTFRSELKGEIDPAKFRKKTRRFAWKIGWDGQVYAPQRVENVLDLWRADFLGGKLDAAEIINRFDAIQGEIRQASAYLMERASRLDWAHFGEFARAKGLVGEPFGRFKEQVREQVMMNTTYRLTDPQFLEQEYQLYWTPSSLTSTQME